MIYEWVREHWPWILGLVNKKKYRESVRQRKERRAAHARALRLKKWKPYFISHGPEMIVEIKKLRKESALGFEAALVKSKENALLRRQVSIAGHALRQIDSRIAREALAEMQKVRFSDGHER